MQIRFTILASFLLACSDKGITVFNPNPEAEITSHFDGDTAVEGYVTVLEGNVDDPNHTAEELVTAWKSVSRTLCEGLTPEGDGAVSCEAILTTADSEIILEVRDADNARGEARVSLDIIPSQNPEAEIITPLSSGIYYTDHLITFEGFISDAEDDYTGLTAFWESNRDGMLSEVDATPSSLGVVKGYGYLSEGEHALEQAVAQTVGVVRPLLPTVLEGRREEVGR